MLNQLDGFTAAMKSVQPPAISWMAASPETVAYLLFGGLALIVFYVFSR
jgi:hypothetical protein